MPYCCGISSRKFAVEISVCTVISIMSPWDQYIQDRAIQKLAEAKEANSEQYQIMVNLYELYPRFSELGIFQLLLSLDITSWDNNRIEEVASWLKDYRGHLYADAHHA
jgi:hypothetical protein